MFTSGLDSKQDVLIQQGTIGGASTAPSMLVQVTPDIQVAAPVFYNPNSQASSTGTYYSAPIASGGTVAYRYSDTATYRVFCSRDPSANVSTNVDTGMFTSTMGMIPSGGMPRSRTYWVNLEFYPDYWETDTYGVYENTQLFVEGGAKKVSGDVNGPRVHYATLGTTTLQTTGETSVSAFLYSANLSDWSNFNAGNDASVTAMNGWVVVNNWGSLMTNINFASNIYYSSVADMMYVMNRDSATGTMRRFPINSYSGGLNVFPTFSPSLPTSGYITDVSELPTGVLIGFDPVSTRMYTSSASAGSTTPAWTSVGTTIRSNGCVVKLLNNHDTIHAVIYNPTTSQVQAVNKDGTIGTAYSIPYSTAAFVITDIVYYKGCWLVGGQTTTGATHYVAWRRCKLNIFTGATTTGDWVEMTSIAGSNTANRKMVTMKG